MPYQSPPAPPPPKSPPPPNPPQSDEEELLPQSLELQLEDESDELPPLGKNTQPPPPELPPEPPPQRLRSFFDFPERPGRLKIITKIMIRITAQQISVENETPGTIPVVLPDGVGEAPGLARFSIVLMYASIVSPIALS